MVGRDFSGRGTARGTGHIGGTRREPGVIGLRAEELGAKLTLSDAGLRPVNRRVAKVGTVPVRPTVASAATLRPQGHARVQVRVTFAPAGGSPVTPTRTVWLMRTGSR